MIVIPSTAPDAVGVKLSETLAAELRHEWSTLESSPQFVELVWGDGGQEHYIDLLVRWHRVVSTLQPGVDAALDRRCPELGWLLADLHDLGVTPCGRWSSPPPVSRPEALGYRYVLETHHQRARIYLPALQRHAGLVEPAWRFFGAEAARSGTWRATMGAIDGVRCDERRAVLTGARATMAAILSAFDAR